MKDILQRENPVLRETARSVPPGEIGSPAVAKVIDDMKRAVHSQKDGVAIAAPQIGSNLRIFLINGELLRQADKRLKHDGSDLVFINPEIVRTSREKKDVEEGCLSVRWLYGKVKRSVRVTLKALNEKGEHVERGASGLLAQIFQHEVDHLNGILFIDKAKEVWEMTEEEIKELEGR
ncbi:MAG: peptide deformylase [Patescibacteria group bacterium]|nr:peptide deformylase [Patescibacteria group bacterium]MDE1941019.1 peptide deformylase [Patescibacteria group bacterium]MDE1967052.1 peptide deformylase [Patescibacteria group bacterium]